MKRNEAIEQAVRRVDEKGYTIAIARRGNAYEWHLAALAPRKGWRIAEMIGPGNVHNFRAIGMAAHKGES